MALINIDSALRDSLAWLKKSPEGGTIGLYSYKRNRKVLITRLPEGLCMLKEDGYATRTLFLKMTDLSKTLKTIIRHEFPRSRKVRLYKFMDEADPETEYQKV